MLKILSCCRLDLITIKPYLTPKNLIIFAAISLFMAMNSGIVSVVSFFMVFGVIYISYPFAVGEKNGIDVLYCTLPITRKSVVVGRYCYAIVINLVSLILGIVLAFVASLLLKKPFYPAEIIAVAAGSLFLFGLIESFQLPLYFKYGYTKARLMTYLPFFLIMVILFLSSQIAALGNLSGIIDQSVHWIDSNPFLMLVIALLILIAIQVLSGLLSLKFYRNRDF